MVDEEINGAQATYVRGDEGKPVFIPVAQPKASFKIIEKATGKVWTVNEEDVQGYLDSGLWLIPQEYEAMKAAEAKAAEAPVAPATEEPANG